MQLSVKNVDERIFREFKAEAVREGLPVGKSLTLAMKFWIQQSRKTSKVRFLDFEPTAWGKGTERTSIEIDKILY